MPRPAAVQYPAVPRTRPARRGLPRTAQQRVYLDQPGDVVNYLTIMDQLSVQAETDTASTNMIKALIRQI